MKRNIGNIWLSNDSFDAVNEMFYKIHAKNISHVMDTIVHHYITNLAHVEALIQEIAKLKRELKECQEARIAYRGQLQAKTQELHDESNPI